MPRSASDRFTWRWTAGAILALAVWASVVATAVAAEFTSYALVREDASLLIRGKVVRLFGLFIPENERICKFFVRPGSCGARAAVALDFRITGFVTCREMAANRDGSIDAICYVDRSSFKAGTDLGAYLIEKGLALARPEAPFAYHALERIARANHRGVWGFQVDTITRQ